MKTCSGRRGRQPSPGTRWFRERSSSRISSFECPPQSLMDDTEAKGLRREILDDVGAILRGQLAAETWGRSLVEVVRGSDGQPVVSGIDVEEEIGDEPHVDATV